MIDKKEKIVKSSESVEWLIRLLKSLLARPESVLGRYFRWRLSEKTFETSGAFGSMLVY